MKHRTKTIKKTSPFSSHLGKYPSAGPYPNITGMKKLYWGEDAYCVRCGVYVYKVDKTFYDNCK